MIDECREDVISESMTAFSESSETVAHKYMENQLQPTILPFSRHNFGSWNRSIPSSRSLHSLGNFFISSFLECVRHGTLVKYRFGDIAYWRLNVDTTPQTLFVSGGKDRLLWNTIKLSD